jgi:tetratricopeptide (TPR) repeat protein
MTRRRVTADVLRTVRFWGAVGLAIALAASAITLEDGGTVLVVAALVGLFALILVLRLRPPGLADGLRLVGAARIALLVALAGALLALGWSRIGEQRVRGATLCAGQSLQLGTWNLGLKDIQPVAGPGYTALRAGLAARQGWGEKVALAPELREPMIPGLVTGEGVVARLPLGDLAVAVTRHDRVNDCVDLDARWRPLAGWAGGLLLLAALAAGLLALAAAQSLVWRANARARIAMRREDRPLPGAAPPKASAMRRRAGVAGLAALTAAGLVGLYLARQPAPVSAPVYEGGAALVDARRSLVEGPADRNRWIVIADAMARRGHYSDAAEVLQGAVASDPRDAQGWLALGDALYGHAGGQLTPAADLAYRRADRAAAQTGATQLPVALAMLRSGRNELALHWLRSHQQVPPTLIEGTGGNRPTP